MFASLDGRLLDIKTHLPIANAKVFDIYHETLSDQNGTFSLPDSNETIHVKAIGYRPYHFTCKNANEHLLTSIHIQALYLSFWGAGLDSKTLKNMMQFIDDHQINAVVVDIKNEEGLTSYKTDYAQANRLGTAKNRTIKDIDAFVNLMHSKNIYLIGRVVVFKDDLLTKAYPIFALKDQNKTIWTNRSDIAWVDPYLSDAYGYVLNIAADAAQKGFDEINFDYVRFPAHLNLEFYKQNTQENRIDAIENFIQRAQEKLRPYGTFISVNTYGMVCWAEDDTHIGHTIPSLAQNTDYLCPMLYPSGFAEGSFGFKNPAAYPYDVIYRSVKHISDEIDPKRIRPWIQGFRDYAFDRREYNKKEIQAQIAACKECDTGGWMCWNPSSKYQEKDFIPISESSH